MNSKADYLVTKVRYNGARTHIDAVAVAASTGGPEERWARAKVVAYIQHFTFVTAPPGGAAGARIQAVTVKGQTYLRTVADGTAADNLGSLPEL